VCNDLKVTNVSNWKKLALNRKACNDLVFESHNPQRAVKLMEEENR
jgi:hypothetical protein